MATPFFVPLPLHAMWNDNILISKMKRKYLLFMLAFIPLVMNAQVDYSVVQVNEESGINFTQITSDNDYVCMPEIKRTGRGINWLSNRLLDISIDGNQLAYLSFRSNKTNIFINRMSNLMYPVLCNK